MNPSFLTIKSLIYDAFINGAVWVGFAATWVQNLDVWIKIVTGVSAIVLSWVTIYFKIKNDNKKE